MPQQDLNYNVGGRHVSHEELKKLLPVGAVFHYTGGSYNPLTMVEHDGKRFHVTNREGSDRTFDLDSGRISDITYPNIPTPNTMSSQFKTALIDKDTKALIDAGYIYPDLSGMTQAGKDLAIEMYFFANKKTFVTIANEALTPKTE
jgi:hypothetical protein